jgi:Amylo-alpha-1,6-glucosidase
VSGSGGARARSGPILLTSLASAALGDGRGDLELPREMRGAATDWGGVFAQCVRLTGPWRLGLSADGQEGDLPRSLVASESAPGAWRTRHSWNGFEIQQEVAAVGSPPGVVRSLRIERPSGPAGPLRVTSSFAPWLLPVLVEGIRPHRFRIDANADGVRIRQRGFGLSFRSDPTPSAGFVNGTPWDGTRFGGRAETFASQFDLTVAPGVPAGLRLFIGGGLDRTIDGTAPAAASVLADPAGAARAVGEADRAWEALTPELRFPDAPDLERGYRLARSALRRLYAAPGDNLVGLLAGFPWYSALWCRDIAWMLPAVVWMGDFDWARRTVDTVLRFQSPRALPILGGEVGELPMQISPGPIFLYGTSDTSLYYPSLIEAWLRHSGEGLPPEWAGPVRSMLAWGRARTSPDTGLLRNGGEAEEISSATRALSRIRYGIDSPDTTIWDSTDRRAHAIDVQVLWWQALRDGANVLGRTAAPLEPEYSQLGERVADAIRTRYRWPEEGYLFDSIRDGQGTTQVRPNALRTVSAGLFSPEEGRPFVRRAAQDDLSVAWGVRTLSARDPGYDPIAYHDGEVWPIATAWAADAALAVGETGAGTEYLLTLARQLVTEDGFASECYRGDRPEPFNACFLLGFSIAPFLTVLFERLWGITVDVPGRCVTLRPRFPSDWRSAAVERLRVGAGTLALDWTPARWSVSWAGPEEIVVVDGPNRVRVPAGGTAELPASGSGQAS